MSDNSVRVENYDNAVKVTVTDLSTGKTSSGQATTFTRSREDATQAATQRAAENQSK
jgi:hypothetical protein